MRTRMTAIDRKKTAPWKRCMVASAAIMGLAGIARAQIWSEEFNYTSAPDSTVWSYDTGDWGWGNNELQNYTTSTNNVWVDGSNLVIRAVKQGSGGGATFTSGRIRTQDKLTFKYGTIEARISTPDLSDGLWPAFWTLGNSFPPWPDCGEIDIMEMGIRSAIDAGTVNRRVGSAGHWESSGNHALYSDDLTLGSDIDGTFVIYRMEWTPTFIRTYIDGNLIWTFAIGNPAGFDGEEFHEPHFIILNMAVGGNYPQIWNASGITAPFPAEYRVDWIRIYDNGYTELGGTSLEPSTPTGANLLANPGFESGTDGWNLNLSGGSASASSAFAHGGANALCIDSSGSGDWNSPNLSQSFPAAPGDVFNMKGYMWHPSGSPISDGSFGLFKIEFRDSDGIPLDPASIDIGTGAGGPYYGAESVPHLDAASAADSWIFSEAQAEAPAGTVEVGFYILNVNPPGNSGPAMYFDDVYARLAGDPALPVAMNVSVSGGDVQISFPTEPGVTYEISGKNNITNATWIPIETIIGDGHTNSVSYPANNAGGVYRITSP